MTGTDELDHILQAAAHAVTSVSTSLPDEIRALTVAARAIEAALCDRLTEMNDTRAYAAEDASTIAAWARRELHQDAGKTRQYVRAGATLRTLPQLGRAARSGKIGFEHVNLFPSPSPTSDTPTPARSKPNSWRSPNSKNPPRCRRRSTTPAPCYTPTTSTKRGSAAWTKPTSP